ncbi:PHB depolymerase family esterase [Caulobacter sp. UNC358MFTsu5.1]|uniref:alpha/beta hydrolase family esterase n=1 Tax=Caulobacter sp. UNC358MFTsu5.1 TaxID=1449049 RepID=UPI0018CC3202|nr:hypothetical protein [Caulobacter sp. UNC358MFTsu5.1]
MVFVAAVAGLAFVSPAWAAPETRTLTVDGAERRFELTTISAPPRAILIALHPRPASGAAMRHISDLDADAGKGGFIVAYPNGINGGWAADEASGRADEAFIAALAVHLRARLASPTTPVFLVGVSNGAAMAERMLLAQPNLFAGAALVSGGLPAPDKPAQTLRRPVGPLIVMIGDSDQNAAQLAASAQARRARYGCRLRRELATPGAARAVYDCQGQVLEEWRMQAGHVWPGAVDSGPLSWPDAPYRASQEILRTFALGGD